MGHQAKQMYEKKSSVLCRKKLVKNVFILFCLFEHIFNQSLGFASSTKSCLRGPELGFNRPIFAIIFLHRIVIRTPKMVRDKAKVETKNAAQLAEFIQSDMWEVVTNGTTVSSKVLSFSLNSKQGQQK